MSVRSVLTDARGEGATLPAWRAAGRGMSLADAAAVVVLSVGVIILTLAEPKGALSYLLAFPIWIVSRDLGPVTGAAVGACAFLFLIVVGAEDAGALGHLARAAVFSGAVAAGAQGRRPEGSGGGPRRPSPLLGLLTARPEITRRPSALSHRELEILENIATGAKNADIADRFVISQNTVKSHVSQILKKLSVANRTEAAFRYVELYGAPTPAEGSSTTVDVAGHEEGTAEIGATSAVSATVFAFNRKHRALLRLQDGRDLEVALLEQMRGRVQIGDSAIVYFDQRDGVVGWYLPGEELGVDLRHWAP